MDEQIENILQRINEKSYDVPTTTSNQLSDVLNWLENNSVVILYNKYGQCLKYHNNCANSKFDDRICCVSCESVPGILEPGEWDWYIDQKNAKCTCPNITNVTNNLIKHNAKNVFAYKT